MSEERLARIEQRIEDVVQNVEVLKTDVRVLKTDVGELKTDVAELKIELEKVSRSTVRLEARFDDMQALSIERFDRLRDEMRRGFADMSADINRWNDPLALAARDHTRRLDDHDVRITALESRDR